MSRNNLEDELRKLKLAHLTENELAAYCDQELDPIRRMRVEAHVKECFRCESELALLLEESAALSNHQIPAQNGTLVEPSTEQTGSLPRQSSAGSAEIAERLTWPERLADYLRPMIASWRMELGAVRRGPTGSSDPSEEVWRWQSADGAFQACATMEKNADLTVYFSSNEMELEGAQLDFRVGSLNQRLTLRRVSESEVGAQVAIPWPFRQGNNMADISIEIV
jgi:hypothetical protein